jgi:CRP/FNR family cyclic AMP-dependent transcriptional regulator
MSAPERIPLLDAGLELTRDLSDTQLAELSRVSLPVITLSAGEHDLPTLLARHDAFGATVIDGLVMYALRIGNQTGIQLLGPSDLLVSPGELFPDWLTERQIRTIAPVRLAVFGSDLLAAVHRWPPVIRRMHACLGDQFGRLTAQLVICQLPRVDERVLAMFWLLAESWGQVTPNGVRLTLTLTHETLGALIGARRPTVTLALRKLTEEGALLHQDSGWLLLRHPPETAEAGPKILPPEVADQPLAHWTPARAEAPEPELAYAELRDRVRRLRAEHSSNQQRVYEQLQRVRSQRVRTSAIRARIQQQDLTRRGPPSS